MKRNFVFGFIALLIVFATLVACKGESAPTSAPREVQTPEIVYKSTQTPEPVTPAPVAAFRLYNKESGWFFSTDPIDFKPEGSAHPQWRDFVPRAIYDYWTNYRGLQAYLETAPDGEYLEVTELLPLAVQDVLFPKLVEIGWGSQSAKAEFPWHIVNGEVKLLYSECDKVEFSTVPLYYLGYNGEYGFADPCHGELKYVSEDLDWNQISIRSGDYTGIQTPNIEIRFHTDISNCSEHGEDLLWLDQSGVNLVEVINRANQATRHFLIPVNSFLLVQDSRDILLVGQDVVLKVNVTERIKQYIMTPVWDFDMETILATDSTVLYDGDAQYQVFSVFSEPIR